MALPLNVFQTITNVAPSDPVGIYTAPVGYSGVVLLAQATKEDVHCSSRTARWRGIGTAIAVHTPGDGERLRPCPHREVACCALPR